MTLTARSQPLLAVRTAGVLLAFVIGVSGCAGPPGSSGEAPVPASAPASPGALATSVPPLPDELSAEDEALVAELQAEGYSEAEALFIALTEVEVEPLGEYSQRIRYAFPTGNSADITVTLVPDQPGEGQGTDALTMTSSEADGGFSFELEYFIPYDSMPADVRDEVANGTVTVDARLALAGMVPLTGPVAASDGIGVIVKGVVDKLQDKSASKFLKFLDKQLGGPGVLDKFYKGVKAGLAIKDALAMQSLHGELERQLDELEECVRNPTNPQTQKAYRDDPGYLDRILEQITSVREEVKTVTAVMFIAKMNQTAAGLLAKKVPWLSFVVGPLTSWSKAALDGVNAKLIEDLKKNISSCELGFALDLTGSDIRLRTAGIGTDTTADLVGQVLGCPIGDDAWTFGGATTLTYSSGTASVNDHLLDLEGDQSPGAFTVVLSPLETVELHNQFTPPHFAVSHLTVTDALGSPTVVFTLYNGLGERVGDFSLDVVAVDPDCESPTP